MTINGAPPAVADDRPVKLPPFRFAPCRSRTIAGMVMSYEQCATSIPLRSMSVAGVRPMEKDQPAPAFVQAQRWGWLIFFRTAHRLTRKLAII